VSLSGASGRINRANDALGIVVILRVIDESGEDYGYAAARFFLLSAPESLRRALDESTKRTPAAGRRRLAPR